MLPGSASEHFVVEVNLSQEAVERTGRRNLCLAASKHHVAVALRQGGGLHIHNFQCNAEGFDEPKDTKLEAIQVCDAALMNDTETKLLLLNTAENRIYEVDMEYGTVVQDFTSSDKLHIQAMSHSAHVACVSPTYTCLAENAAFTLDMRTKSISHNCSVSSKNIFTCHATSACGHLVIGDDAGIVRLFKGPPGLCDAAKPCGTEDAKAPIVDIDVTANGEWILVVCAKYVLLWRASFEETGLKNMWKMPWRKSSALCLQPSASQLAALGGIDKLNFTAGGFDRYGTDKEMCIMACSGKYIFTWNFETVTTEWGGNEVTPPESARADRRVIALSAMVPDRVIYATSNDIRMAPLRWALTV